MKHRILSILFLLWGISIFTYAGSTTKTSCSIRWAGISSSSISAQKILTFDESALLDESFLPYFTKEVDLSNNGTIDSLSIQNVVYADFSEAEKQIIAPNLSSIPEKISPSLRYTIDRKEKKAVISFLPIIIQNGVAKKVLSFDIVYQTNANPSLRLANTSGLSLHSYAAHSVLASGSWIKISVPSSGIYKITYEDLISWGISDPANAHIYGYGGAMLPENFKLSKTDDLPELSVYMEKGSDGVFNAGDYILFYAQGPVSWKYNSTRQKFNRTVNPYSFYGYYFITSDVGTEKTISTKTVLTDTPNNTVDYFLDRQLHENETTNIASSGKEWYGETYNSSTASYSTTFSVPNIYSGKTATVQVDAAGKAGSATTMTVSADGQSLGSFSFAKITDGSYNLATADSGTYKFTTTSTSSITVKTVYNNPSVGTAWLNYIILNIYRSLNMSGSDMFFRNPDVVGSGNFAQYNVTGASGLTFWNITDPTNAQAMPASYTNGIYSFVDSASTLQEYVAVDPSGDFSTPTLVGKVSNQDLHSVSQADFVIISAPEYLSQAQALANKHIQQDGLSVLIVTPTQVYNEFSSGTPDATAYRWLMKMLYDRATSTSDAPKYLLLFGDGTYDNRGISSANASVNKILTYQSAISLNEVSSYTTDDYFGLLDDSEGTSIQYNSMDIGVGRFPVSTATEATNMVNKTITYMENSSKGSWKNRLGYIADDADTSDDKPFTYQTDSLAKYIEKNFQSYQPQRFLLDAYTETSTATGQSYPLAKEKLFNLINSGALLINYLGHGSTEGLASEGIITRNDVSSIRNKVWPLFFAGTCNFADFDKALSSSGEDLVLNSEGGAIGLFSAARTAILENNYTLNKYFNNNILKIENGSPLAIGEVARRAKNSDNTGTNKLCYVLLADPALKLPLPLNKVVTDTIITNINSDTVKALTTVTVKGEIQDANGSLLSSFNGIVHLTIYDKKVTTTTLGNDAGSQYTYTERPSTLYTGRFKVENGLFTATLVIPKDINYSYGTGRINYYAADTVNDLEANGYNENFIIGGTNSNFEFEDNGPVINMYLNSSNFKSGNTVDATSVLYAQLSDDSGINTGNSLIGHDLLLTFDGDSTVVVTDYYESSLDDYKSGSLTYQLPTLSNGSYTLSLRAWDVLDNSSTSTISFNVDNSKSPDIYDLYAYPNPASSYVKFVLKHDQPESNLTVKVEVFDVAGQVLWRKSTTTYAESSTTEITWDLNTNNGKINPGIYIYRISVTSEEDGVLASESNKLIVK